MIDPDPTRERNPYARAARIAWLLANGAILTTRQIAEMLGMTPQGAAQMMDAITPAIPIDKNGKEWYRCEKAPE